MPTPTTETTWLLLHCYFLALLILSVSVFTPMTTKRAYKLQEFVAHSATVNCLKIGRKSSRLLVTGGEDHKVNLWAIGKPNAILSLSGHASGIDSVSFDSSEVLVAAGAASGTIKLWDLEEAKIVRTLTGHRSNCISVDFHPFGEFFASGSLDTNLKIWDIRKKGCIHTYKGHTRGVSVIRFTLDGRWIVSGGEDKTVKLWDLTAGKLLHDFKSHEGQIYCIDFHPHEFLLATGSADRTVKFWDLETFELIGSSGPETSGVRCLTFNPDGRTLLCGLHESLKVVSWEPIVCHDGVDVGWSRLSDLNVHEGKLLGCSHNQSCVGVWVVDISQIEPYAVASVKQSNGQTESKSGGTGNSTVFHENNMKTSLGRLSVSDNSDTLSKETKSLGRTSFSQNSDPIKESTKESKIISTGNVTGTPQKVNLNASLKTNVTSSISVPNASAPRKSSAKTHSAVNISVSDKADVVPVIVRRTNTRIEQASESRKEICTGERQFPLQPNSTDFLKCQNIRDDVEQSSISFSRSTDRKATHMVGAVDRNILPVVKGSVPGISIVERNIMDDNSCGSGRFDSSLTTELPTNFWEEIYDSRGNKENGDTPLVESQKGGRLRSFVMNWERRGGSSNYEGHSSSTSPGTSLDNMLQLNMSKQRGRFPSTENETVSIDNEDLVIDMMQEHDQFTSSMQSRLAKLQVVHRYWERNEVKGALGAVEKMADHSVLADVICIISEKINIVTLDICTCLLPLLSSLLASDMDRHLSICLDMLLKVVRMFGSMIYSTVSTTTPIGVDIEAEQRLERYNLCYVELEKVKRCLISLTRRGGSVAKSAHKLSLAFQEIS
ncbi:hypothetical protein K2173_009010 [Erythroxylum novogranatense]|uniref:Katanin p80 WD40 repeat-containing subunit B1 homolog n=1 Tax=Erythroxylum novogranatense TaxID=1862640 RepID=A0AAV8TUQ8_9ROSI|nr:hypothetical protein K2173_009010 [Erythroxylum novogranatense]